MSFNTDLYEEALRERHKDVQREMERLRLLASLQRSKPGLRRQVANESVSF